MINNKPNIFQWATKELSQDAVLLYLADCYNHKDTQNIGRTFLTKLGCDTNGLCCVYPIKQYYFKTKNTQFDKYEKSHVDAIFLLAYGSSIDKINHFELVVIEDKTGTSSHNNQLTRYKSYFETRFANEFKSEDHNVQDFTSEKLSKVHCIYFKPLLYDDNEDIYTTQKCGWTCVKNNDVFDIFESCAQNETMEAFLDNFSVVYGKYQPWFKIVTWEDLLKDKEFDQRANTTYGQWVILKLFLQKAFENEVDYATKFHIGRQFNYGGVGTSPWTQYRFVFGKNDKGDTWYNLDPQKELKHEYRYFLRLEKGKISCKQYWNTKGIEDISEKIRTKEEKDHDRQALVKYLCEKIGDKQITDKIKELSIKSIQDNETDIWSCKFSNLQELNKLLDAVRIVQKYIVEYIKQQNDV